MAIGDDPDASGKVVLVGYPSATLDKEDLRITGRPTAIMTASMDKVPANSTPPVNPTLDLFLQLSRRAIDEAGEIVDIPRIHGMSGCAIWQLRENDGRRVVVARSCAAPGWNPVLRNARQLFSRQALGLHSSYTPKRCLASMGTAVYYFTAY